MPATDRLPTPLLAALPVKPFGAAKGRLDGLLNAAGRADLALRTAEHVAATCETAGLRPVVVTGDPQVAAWAAARGLEVIAEPPGGGLNGAAGAVAEEAGRRGLPWCIIHADLPLLAPQEVDEVIGRLRPGAIVLAPSRNGGTNLLAGAEPLAFAYGPGSFARHLAAARRLERHIVVAMGTALDVDTPDDLRAAAAHPRGAWLARYLPEAAEG